jgi:hypothetical protein
MGDPISSAAYAGEMRDRTAAPGSGRNGHPGRRIIAGRARAPHPRRSPATHPVTIRFRSAMNWVNLSTPLGVAVALAGGARFERGPHGVLLARGYRWRVPPVRGRAITIGDVVLIGLDDDALAARPALITHEARHCGQYARWLGPLGFLPAYGLAALWSWLRTGDPALANGFEVAAGLVDGGYRPGDRREPA